MSASARESGLARRRRLTFSVAPTSLEAILPTPGRGCPAHRRPGEPEQRPVFLVRQPLEARHCNPVFDAGAALRWSFGGSCGLQRDAVVGPALGLGVVGVVVEDEVIDRVDEGLAKGEPPRRKTRRVSVQKCISAWFSQDACGVWWMWNLGCPRARPRLRGVGRAVVHDQVDVQVPWDRLVRQPQEIDESVGVFAGDGLGEDLARCGRSRAATIDTVP